MSKPLSIKAQSRKAIGRSAIKETRRSGNVPAILYGKKGNYPIQINAIELKAMLHHATSENVLVDVELTDAGKTDKRLALLQDVQHHPLEDYILHIDLQEIAQDEKIHAEVPLQETGEPLGVKLGGLLEISLRTLKVECLPKDLPTVFTVDVSGLEIGKSIHVSDIKAPEGVTILNHKELTVFTVKAPKEEEVKPATPEEVKQPEVIKEKKVEEAPEAAASGKGKAEAKGKPEAKK